MSSKTNPFKSGLRRQTAAAEGGSCLPPTSVAATGVVDDRQRHRKYAASVSVDRLSHGAGVRSTAAAADSVTVDPPNKKPKMLMAAIEPVQPASTSTDDYSHVIAQEVTAYLSPLRLIDEEKMSPLVFWKHHADYLP